WFHTLIQVLALGMLLLLGDSVAAFEPYAVRLDKLLFYVDWPYLVVAILLFQYPITELLVQQCHYMAYVFFSRKATAYRVLASVFVVATVYTAFVFVDCVVWLFTVGKFPEILGPVSFWGGWGDLFVEDLPLLGVPVVAEIVRQMVLSERIMAHYRLMQEKIKEI
ncbi:MAG: hypothetical protein AAF570_22650, partial [Bacteroidota bacterium]